MKLVSKTAKSKILYSLMTIMAVSTLTTQAQAISLRFKSKVFSSGPTIYACNAGVATQTGGSNKCFFGGNPANGTCTPLSCTSAKENCNTDCVCSTNLGRQWAAALLKANYVPYTSASDTGGVAVQKYATSSSFTPMFSASDAWDKRIYNLATFFQTEVYNGAYFFDICYRGSQIPSNYGSFHVQTQASGLPFDVTSPTGFASMDNNRTGLNMDPMGVVYTTKSGLTVQSYKVCGTTQAQAEFNVDANNLPTGAAAGGQFGVSPVNQALNASVVTNDLGGTIGAKFCKVRYVIRETSYLNPLAPLRDHKAEGAEVCTYTTIQDPPGDGETVNP